MLEILNLKWYDVKNYTTDGSGIDHREYRVENCRPSGRTVSVGIGAPVLLERSINHAAFGLQ